MTLDFNLLTPQPKTLSVYKATSLILARVPVSGKVPSAPEVQ